MTLPGRHDVLARSFVPAIDLGQHKDIILGVYYFLLALGGCVGLPLTVATMVFTKTVNRRHPTLLNFLLVWFAYAMASLILLFARQEKTYPPEFRLCLAQASLVYATTVAAAAGTLGLVLQLWMDIRAVRFSKSPRIIFALVAFPWILFILISVGCIIFASMRHEVVTLRWLFYCSLESNAVIWIVSALTLTINVLIIVFQGSVMYKLYNAARQSRSVNRSAHNLTIRVSVFAVYSIVTLLVSLVLVLKPTLIFAYIFISSLPLAVFLVFGTQKEHFRIWFGFWQKPEAQRHLRLEPIVFKAERSDATTSTVLSEGPGSAGAGKPDDAAQKPNVVDDPIVEIHFHSGTNYS